MRELSQENGGELQVCQDEIINRAIEYLSTLSANVDTENVHWIHGADESEGWCYNCCYYKVRNLRHRDRKNRNEYCVDGGWGTEEDGSRVCAGCGKPLDCTLTRYGIESELDHFLEVDFLSDKEPIKSITAYELLRVFEDGQGYEEFEEDLIKLAGIVLKQRESCPNITRETRAIS